MLCACCLGVRLTLFCFCCSIYLLDSRDKEVFHLIARDIKRNGQLVA